MCVVRCRELPVRSTQTLKTMLRWRCIVAILLWQDIAAWNLGVATSFTGGRQFQPFSLKLFVGDEQHVASDVMSLDDAILTRYSCKKFRRYRQKNMDSPSKPSASESDPTVVQRVVDSLNLARRAPTSFNTQPYKVVLVTSPEQKMALSQYCLGPNRQKVLDADCTAIFLADKQIMRTFSSLRKLIGDIGIMKKYRPLTRKALLTTQLHITIFSSGYPLPRFISSTISFAVRTCMACLHFISKWFNYPLPTLANAETWASKQVMMVAMTYILACTARGLATAPMEGINASGIRKVIKAPSRYAIPLIVSTGIPYDQNTSTKLIDGNNDTRLDDRYKIDELIFGESFGSALPITEFTNSSYGK